MFPKNFVYWSRATACFIPSRLDDWHGTAPVIWWYGRSKTGLLEDVTQWSDLSLSEAVRRPARGRRYVWRRLICTYCCRSYFRVAGHRTNKKSRAISDTPSHSYEVSLATWEHTVLPSTRHEWTRPALTPAIQAGISWFIYPRGIEGWVDLGETDWLHTEMVYPPTDGHPSKY